VDTLYAGEVGYLAAQIKSVLDARVGDTVTLAKEPAAQALEGYEDVQPMVYCGLFPTDADDYQVCWLGCLCALGCDGTGGCWHSFFLFVVLHFDTAG
jgi:hypothetical protein